MALQTPEVYKAFVPNCSKQLRTCLEVMISRIPHYHNSIVQDKPCDICGDIGVVEAIVTCSQCRIACEHLYCMKIYTTDVPEVWICEACELSTETASLKSGVNEELPNAVYHDTTCSADSKKLADNSGRRICFKMEKTVTGKVKEISAQEVIMLASGARKSESPSKGNLHSSPGRSKAMVSMSMRTPVKTKATHPKFSLYKVKENPRFRLPEHFKPPRHGNDQINSVVQPQATERSKELQGNRAVLAPMTPLIHKGQPMVVLKRAVEIESTCTNVEKATCNASYASSLSKLCPTIVSSGDNICTDVVEPRNSSAENGDLLLKADKCFPSHPALDASWKGSFKILDPVKHGELTDGLHAHPPSRVRQKVYEFSKRMPRILQFELLPRCKFWTDMFRNDYPDTDDIALYFFSHDSGRSEDYVFLLEYIERHDLVMRSNMDGIELLVLTSKLLHLNSQRLNEKYFLWGVFRRMKKYEAISKEHGKIPTVCASDSTHDSLATGEDSEVVDMEIDMVGGKDVGRVDIAILKESIKIGCGETATSISLRGSDVKNPTVSTKMDFTNKLPLLELKMKSCPDIPPGFEEACRLKSHGSFRATVKEEKQLQKAISPAKENMSMEKVPEASGGSNSRPEPMEDSDLLGAQERFLLMVLLLPVPPLPQ
ncbi:PHD finger-containing protein 6 isoform X2 [Cornus florida]|uniref:PHD finger-containing protein 6 isoform X2 n=1 Tax=Cornus florida TaxID=4283 RepID=UPI002896C4A6|nr:PHD finger-containing protein 6 isoform X2 [Cornus florida]